MEKLHFTLISGNQQFTTIHNVEEVSFGLNGTEAGCSKMKLIMPIGRESQMKLDFFQ